MTPRPAPRPAHPAPEVPARPAADDELARPVRTMIRKIAPGWAHTVQYGRGAKPLTRSPWVGDPVSALLLSARHRTCRIATAALWHDGKFHTALAWAVCVDAECRRAGAEHAEDVPVALTSRELAALLAEPTPDLSTHHHARGLERLAGEVARHEAFLERRRKDHR